MAKYISYLCVLLLLLIGCATFGAKQRMKLFDETSSAYEKALNYGNYRVASKFARGDGTKHQAPDFNYLKGIKVTSYELLESVLSPDNLKAQLAVEISYFHANFLTEKTLIDEQLWEYNETEERWHLLSGLPDFK